MSVLFMMVVLSAAAGIDGGDRVPANTCPSQGKTIHVHVHGIRQASGTVKVVLYGPDPTKFLGKGKWTDKGREPAQEGTMTICVAAPSAGKYAVAAYHDENDNHKFDRNWMGLPTEGFGVSNNPPIFLAAPTFEESSFDVRGDLTHVEIEIGY
jgi:uncharacterized protein (DUF2141 family)